MVWVVQVAVIYTAYTHMYGTTFAVEEHWGDHGDVKSTANSGSSTPKYGNAEVLVGTINTITEAPSELVNRMRTLLGLHFLYLTILQEP